MLSPEELEGWQACAAQLADVGVSEAEADQMLAKGFAWTYSGYWGLEKVWSCVFLTSLQIPLCLVI